MRLQTASVTGICEVKHEPKSYRWHLQAVDLPVKLGAFYWHRLAGFWGSLDVRCSWDVGAM